MELFKTKNYGATVQVMIKVAAAYILIRMTHTGILYVQKSCDIIREGGLRFVPTHGCPPEFSEDLHEIFVALSQTIYWSNYLFLTRGGPESRATRGLEKEFQLELPVGGITSIFSRIRLTFHCSEPIRFSLKFVP